MAKVLAPATCSLAQVKRHPTKVLRDAGGFVAVMLEREPAFYLVSPELFEAWVTRLQRAGAWPLPEERIVVDIEDAP